MKIYPVQHEKEAPCESEADLSPLQPFEVRVKVICCGICQSDISLIDNSWGITQYPLIAGHEIIGRVIELGESVTDFQIGDRVGIGSQHDACFACEYCDLGEENLCLSRRTTCIHSAGGFAEYTVGDARCMVKIPELMSSAEAAPLLCAGITVFTPFVNHQIEAGMTVGVVGIGGLGHLALQFSRAKGCHTVAISSSANKEAEAKSLGADEFFTHEQANAGGCANQFDFILCTTSHYAKLDTYLTWLKPKGKLILLGVPSSDASFSTFPLIMGDRAVVGSNIGNRKQLSAMFDFAIEHNIRPLVKEFSLGALGEAVNLVRSGKLGYRVVVNIEGECN